MESRDIAVVIAVLSKILTFINYSIDFFLNLAISQNFSCNITTRGANAYVDDGKIRNRTFGSCRRNYERFIGPPVGRKKKNYPKDFDNCVHPPLIQADDDVLIMELLIPPPLHLFLGLGNRIFDQLHDETMILKSMGLMNQTAYQWAHASPRCM